MSDETLEESNVLMGCDYNSLAMQAMSGKDVIAMVTNATGDKLLAIAGQQGLDFNMSQETSEAATKDVEAGGWAFKFHGNKSWDASIDGLLNIDDEATGMVAKAIDNSEYLCLKICKRIANADGSITYQPIRMGLAIVTSDTFSAANDDNVSYAMDFDGTGKPWLYETATKAERQKAAFTVQPASEDFEG